MAINEIHEKSEFKEIKELENDVIERMNELNPIEIDENLVNNLNHHEMSSIEDTTGSICVCATCVRCPMG